VKRIKYPLPLRKLNRTLSVIAGTLCLVIAFLCMLEVILRYVFRSPSGWTADYSTYLHLWAMFGACGFTYQVNGHVGVDVLRVKVDKVTHSRHHIPRRIMAIISYLMTLVFLGVLFGGTVKMTGKCIKFHTMTTATHPIYALWLYAGMLFGCGLMIITVIFILLDLFTESEEFL
jgi:TRAP-type C4-dicarboxylate transport system permease small subunit